MKSLLKDNTTSYWNEEQTDYVLENCPKYIEQSEKDKAVCSKPTLKERQIVYDAILEYLVQNDKIITGDYAINYFLGFKDGVRIDYKLPYLKFYSKNARVDARRLCDWLLKNPAIAIDAVLGKKLIKVSNEVSETVFGVSVSFTFFCDIIQIDPHIYDFILANKTRYLEQTNRSEHKSQLLAGRYLIIVDLLKILGNIKNEAYWSEMMSDLYKIQTDYDFLQGLSGSSSTSNIDKEQTAKAMLKDLQPILWSSESAHENNCAVTGFVAYNFLCGFFLATIKSGTSKESSSKTKSSTPNKSSRFHLVHNDTSSDKSDNILIELISTNFSETVIKLTEYLKSSNYEISEYYGFFRYFGRSAKIVVPKKNIIFVVYQHDGVSVQIITSKRGINYVSFLCLLQYLLCCQFRDSYMSSKVSDAEQGKQESVHSYTIAALCKMRDKLCKFYDSKSLENALEQVKKTPFKTDVVQTIGKITSEKRESFLRKKYDKSSNFVYDPELDNTSSNANLFDVVPKPLDGSLIVDQTDRYFLVSADTDIDTSKVDHSNKSRAVSLQGQNILKIPSKLTMTNMNEHIPSETDYTEINNYFSSGASPTSSTTNKATIEPETLERWTTTFSFPYIPNHKNIEIVLTSAHE